MLITIYQQVNSCCCCCCGFYFYKFIIYFNNYLILILDTTNGNQNGTEGEESMDIEAGQFEDAEEDP